MYFFKVLSTISVWIFSPEWNNFRKTHFEGQKLSNVVCSTVVYINLNLSSCSSVTYFYNHWLEFLIIKAENYYVLLYNFAMSHFSIFSVSLMLDLLERLKSNFSLPLPSV